MFVVPAPGNRQLHHAISRIAVFLRGLVDRFWNRGVPNAEGELPVPSTAEGCIFCLRNDERLNRIVCENEGFFARHDNYPAAPGHIEIAPKRHVESFFDLTDREILQVYALIRQSRDCLLREIDPPDGYTIGVNEGRAAGRSIDHLHVHVIPRYFGDVKDPRGGIRKAAPNCDPDSWV